MKAKVDKKLEEVKENKSIIVTIDPSLNKLNGKILFPKKLAIAEEKLKGVKLPELAKQKTPQ